jgi:benzoyl-CoA reductase/2-hydroxyglutaryl-CoA dehydratase subunit BcrC/BadD/HgdB
VVGDDYGLILGAKCIMMEMVTDYSLAEVIGALYDGDAYTIRKELYSTPHFFLSKIGNFIETIHDEMQSFRFAKFFFIPRKCNMAAHTLAKEATRNKVE